MLIDEANGRIGAAANGCGDVKDYYHFGVSRRQHLIRWMFGIPALFLPS